jgi:hypothetical protein
MGTLLAEQLEPRDYASLEVPAQLPWAPRDFESFVGEGDSHRVGHIDSVEVRECGDRRIVYAFRWVGGFLSYDAGLC